MSSEKGLPDRLERSSETEGDEILYRFANGLQIRTEVFHKSDPERILPLGSPQCSLMNHLLAFPERARGKFVFEPFAGSGPLGFMALEVGAAHAEFLDINPRAADFHRINAALNAFAPDRFRSITGDIAQFTPERKYDLVLANPPFVPTPDGIEGTLTSAGGPVGSRFVDLLLGRLETFLEPGGSALVYVFQFVRDGQPLVVEALGDLATRRAVEITPSQEHLLPLGDYAEAYRLLFKDSVPAIDHWQGELSHRHGEGLALCHYVIDIGPQNEGNPGWTLRENFAEKFGADFKVPSDSPAELAFGRAFENFVPPA